MLQRQRRGQPAPRASSSSSLQFKGIDNRYFKDFKPEHPSSSALQLPGQSRPLLLWEGRPPGRSWEMLFPRTCCELPARGHPWSKAGTEGRTESRRSQRDCFGGGSSSWEWSSGQQTERFARALRLCRSGSISVCTGGPARGQHSRHLAAAPCTHTSKLRPPRRRTHALPTIAFTPSEAQEGRRGDSTCISGAQVWHLGSWAVLALAAPSLVAWSQLPGLSTLLQATKTCPVNTEGGRALGRLAGGCLSAAWILAADNAAWIELTPG